MQFKAGDLVRYTFKNELGKVKTLNKYMPNHAFVWYHCGDTASCTQFEIIELVLPKERVEEMSREELLEYLHKQKFSNDYAIEKIIDKKEEDQ